MTERDSAARTATTGADPHAPLRAALLHVTDLMRHVADDIDRPNAFPGLARDIRETLDRIKAAEVVAKSGAARAHPGEGEREALPRASLERGALTRIVSLARDHRRPEAQLDRIAEVALRALAAIHGHGMGQEDGFRDGIEAAARVVEQCNREGPYEAIGAAKRIRALADAEAPPSGDDEGALREAADKIRGVLDSIDEMGWRPTSIPYASGWRRALLKAARDGLRALAAPTPDKDESHE